MPIRREDKEFIQALSVLGAVFGAVLGVVLTMHFSDRAHETYNEQTEDTQTQAALAKLKTTVVNPNNPIADENILDQVEKHFEETPTPKPATTKESFWVRLSRISLLGLCTGACVTGAIAGYSSLWVIGWVGSFIVLYTIRLLYLMIRVAAPNSAAARVTGNINKQVNCTGQFQRDDGRVLPVIVKLFFLLLVVLGILSAVVWHLTAI